MYVSRRSSSSGPNRWPETVVALTKTTFIYLCSALVDTPAHALIVLTAKLETVLLID